MGNFLKRLMRLPRCSETWGNQWSWGEHRCKNRAVLDGMCEGCYASRHGYQVTPITTPPQKVSEPSYPISVTMPWGEVRTGRYRWLRYGEAGATGTTLKIMEWDDA